MNRPLEFKINGQHSICLDQHVDTEVWTKMFPEMCLGVALSKRFHEPIEIGHQRAVYDPEHVEPRNFIRNVLQHTEEYKSLMKEPLTNTELHDYVKFRFKTKTLGTKLLLRTYDEYHSAFHAKHLAGRNKDTMAMMYFPALQAWIKSQTVFNEVGRILFFINERQTSTPIHSDYADLRSRKDQFIWINFNQMKPFFVLDKDGQKQYMQGMVNTFDNANWHGSEPTPYACFTLRIDGVFSSSFLDSTGLRSHYEDNAR